MMKKRIGYWFSEKKCGRLNFEENFVKHFRNAGYEVIKLDLSKSLEKQGPFDLLIHKLTDVISQSNHGCAVSQQFVSKFSEYSSSHPDCVVVDPLKSMKVLMDRNELYEIVDQCKLSTSSVHVFTPPFVYLNSNDVQVNKQLLQKANVPYPFVCKPNVAHGVNYCHQMCLVFNDTGLKDIQPPCVAQTFIKHNAVLYKLFVLGEYKWLVNRPSLKNFSAGDSDTIFFHSHDISKPNSGNYMTMLDEEAQNLVQVDQQQMYELGDSLRTLLKMDLFGVDVILECDTNRYAIIDINAFPGYEGVPDLYEKLVSHVDRLLNNNRPAKSSLPDANIGNLVSDSGITTAEGAATVATCAINAPSVLHPSSDIPKANTYGCFSSSLGSGSRKAKPIVIPEACERVRNCTFSHTTDTDSSSDDQTSFPKRLRMDVDSGDEPPSKLDIDVERYIVPTSDVMPTSTADNSRVQHHNMSSDQRSRYQHNGVVNIIVGSDRQLL